eukprot:scaffold20510_cov25-Tisochrysis_lutea.AAC.1
MCARVRAFCPRPISYVALPSPLSRAHAHAVTAEALLQWLLQQCTTLADVPEPLMALRLLLAGALAASEEAQGLEMLAYSFFEQAGAALAVGVLRTRGNLTELMKLNSTEMSRAGRHMVHGAGGPCRCRRAGACRPCGCRWAWCMRAFSEQASASPACLLLMFRFAGHASVMYVVSGLTFVWYEQVVGANAGLPVPCSRLSLREMHAICPG